MSDAEEQDKLTGRDQQSSHIGDEQLSAYIDDPENLSGNDRSRIEQHLHSCRLCQQALADLESIVGTLRTLPPFDVPRMFHLTQEMVQTLDRPLATLQEPVPFYMRHMGAMRGAAAFAAVIFVFILAADILTNNITGQSDSSESLPVGVIERSNATTAEGAAANTAEESSDEEAVEQDTEMSVAEVEEEATSEESAESLAPPVPTSAAADSGEDGGGSDGATATPQAAMQADSAAVDDQDSAAFDTAESEASSESATLLASDSDSDDTRRYFRFAEVTLVIVFTALLSLVVILPRLERSRRR